ncbi:MAG TPA: FHA domain-containing protein [Burkholderiales bacterium]|jgi:pSer/pThr/pTyr-binding forkhead associated (FHA) protein|nr:FHA domain-containing protein [Burkholderiales bacterium]
MAKLILSMDGQVLKEIPLSKERITIGRKAHNDVQIDNLAVSGEHAVIVSIMDDAFLEDLGSTNGTMVNGKAVKKHFLQDNDVVELGKYKLKYMAEKGKPKAVAPAAPAAADFEKTMVLRPGAMKAAIEQARAMAAAGGQPAAAQAVRAAAVQQAGQSAAATGVADKDAKTAPAQAAAPAATAPQSMPAPPAPAAAPRQPVGTIQLLSGANAGKELELLKPLTTLGKPGIQVAVFTRRPHGYFITHVEGTQQPAVNGQSIGNAPHALKDHDVIELAGVKMEFFLKG